MIRTLIVDDREESRYLLNTLLKSSGYEVESACNGAEALDKARQNPPQLIISDLLMPVMDGYTLLREWKADARLKPIPFVVYTATYTDPKDEQLALSLGANAFILKPAEPEDFTARIKQVLAIAAAGRMTAPPPSAPTPPTRIPIAAPEEEDARNLRQYSRVLIHKLEDKMEELDKTNHKLQHDIAERQRVEEELRWKTAFLEAQVDSALDGILVVDSQGRKILQNQRLNELWKIPPQIAENKDDATQISFIAGQLKHPREFTDKVAYLYAHPDEVSRDEINLIDGTILDRYSSPVQDKAGRYFGRIWAFRDITQSRTLEAQFRQAQKMEAIGHLAAGVAHDFNNILAVIQLHASLLKIKPDTSPEQLESASEIEKAAELAANLTRQMLLFSRKQTMEPRDLDLNQSINDMTKMLRRTLGETIQVQFKFALEPLLIHADAGMMDQVLMNLAVNARDAMPKGGQLVIETSALEFDESVREHAPQARPGSFVCLSVGDSGCGIPPENLSRIFEPFFTTKDVGKGTGLGLATVFGIVQQHQGWINVYSEVGHGTAFRIYLPRLGAKSGQESRQAALPPVRGGKETILLVEDEAALRATMRASLSQLGYRVLEAVNGVEALETWKQRHDEIQLLLTDLVMPGGMTGMDLAGRLLQENPKLKVIYTSGYSAEVAGKNCPLEEGVNFLTKPFAARKLAQVVRNCLDKT
jgi:signal transduction histidine kinase/DNA-binding response OmpR family regulator